MRKTDKLVLIKALLSEKSLVNDGNSVSPTKTVVDGGALLHRVRSVKGMTFGSVASVYANSQKKTLPLKTKSTLVGAQYHRAHISTSPQTTTSVTRKSAT